LRYAISKALNDSFQDEHSSVAVGNMPSLMTSP